MPIRHEKSYKNYLYDKNKSRVDPWRTTIIKHKEKISRSNK